MSENFAIQSSQMRTGRRTRWLIWVFAAFVVTLTWLAPVQRYRFERNEAIQNAVALNANRAIMLEQYVTRTLEAADIATLHIEERMSNNADEILRGTAARPARIHGPIAENRSFLGISVVTTKRDDCLDLAISGRETPRARRLSDNLDRSIADVRQSRLFSTFGGVLADPRAQAEDRFGRSSRSSWAQQLSAFGRRYGSANDMISMSGLDA